MNVFAKLLMGAILLFTVGIANAQNVDGTLRVVKGDVQIKSAQSGQTAKARIGEKVSPGDVVITGKEARAKIVMVDNNEINVSPESQIEIQHYEFDPAKDKKDVLLNVIYGKVRAKVEQKYDGKTSKFQVKTPSAVAGVRGTDFMTSYDRHDKSSQVITFKGAVEFGLPGPGGSIKNPVSVTPGKVANSVAGAAPGAPTNMSKSDLAKMDNDTKADSGGGKGDRQPSNDGSKGDKKGDKGADKGNGGGSASNGSSGSDSRGPASSGGPAPTKDVGFNAAIDGAGNADNSHVGTGPTQIIVTAPTAPPPVPTAPKCDICNQLTQNGNSKTNVNISINKK